MSRAHPGARWRTSPGPLSDGRGEGGDGDVGGGQRAGLGVALVGQVAGGDGDERRRERIPDDEVEEGIRDAEGGPESVELRRLSERRAEDRKTKPSQDPAGD